MAGNDASTDASTDALQLPLAELMAIVFCFATGAVAATGAGTAAGQQLLEDYFEEMVVAQC